MSPLEKSILQALADLDSAVRNLATAKPKPDLGALLQQVDGLAQQLPPQSDPQLVHFLQRKSYEKARLYLEGRQQEIQAGRCGH